MLLRGFGFSTEFVASSFRISGSSGDVAQAGWAEMADANQINTLETNAYVNMHVHVGL